MAQVAAVTYLDVVQGEAEDGVATALTPRHPVMVARNARELDGVNPMLSWSFKDLWASLQTPV